MLGIRGHAQMIPFGVNTKNISLRTHEKLAYFLEDIDAMDWYIDVHENCRQLADAMIKEFSKMMNAEKTNAEQKIIRQQNKLFQITEHNLKIISSTLQT